MYLQINLNLLIDTSPKTTVKRRIACFSVVFMAGSFVIVVLVIVVRGGTYHVNTCKSMLSSGPTFQNSVTKS